LAISDGIAFIAMVVAFMSYFKSKDALKIATEQHKERYKCIRPYFMDAFKWQKGEDVYVSFSLRFTNEATLQNTIESIELQLEYYDKNKKFGKAKVDPCLSETPINLEESCEILALPLVLAEKSAKSGWVTFKLPKFIAEDLNIDLYKILASTVDNTVVSIETHIINKVYNEK